MDISVACSPGRHPSGFIRHKDVSRKSRISGWRFEEDRSCRALPLLHIVPIVIVEGKSVGTPTDQNITTPHNILLCRPKGSIRLTPTNGLFFNPPFLHLTTLLHCTRCDRDRSNEFCPGFFLCSRRQIHAWPNDKRKPAMFIILRRHDCFEISYPLNSLCTRE